MPLRSISTASRHVPPLDRARETLAEFFNCHDAEVVFNSGGTEGDNTALFGLLRPGDHLITTSIEHSAILQAAQRVAHFGVADYLRRAAAQRPDRSGGDSARPPRPRPG